MSDRTTVVSAFIKAPLGAVYRAFVEQDAIVAWLPPGTMGGIVHAFEAREGGAFSMSLVYPDDEAPRGKTSARTDTFRGRFLRLVPAEEVTWATEFESADPAFAGEMIVRTTLLPHEHGTQVTITCENSVGREARGQPSRLPRQPAKACVLLGGVTAICGVNFARHLCEARFATGRILQTSVRIAGCANR